MDELIAFVKARLDEDEAAAKSAELGVWQPLRARREVAAKRAILAEHRPVTGITSFPLCRRCGRDDHMEPFPYQWPCATVCAVAAVYSDHPHYRAEWAPAT